jgi:hypothetical protein
VRFGVFGLQRDSGAETRDRGADLPRIFLHLREPKLERCIARRGICGRLRERECVVSHRRR